MIPLPQHVVSHLGWTLLLSALGVLLLTPLVIRLARRLEWVSYPREDRWHGRPTALMGGIAIYGAATVGLFAILSPEEVWAVWGGATLMFAVGAVDDLADVQPAAKLTAQVVATGLLLYAGYAFGTHWPLWLSLPITLLWVLGITNAVNLLDNMDGLAAGIAGIAAVVMAVFAGLIENPTAVALGGAVGGAALGFLVFNYEPARIFMGDCGSLFLGFVVAALALVVQQQAGGYGQVAVGLVPLAVLAVPILDTTLVTCTRRLAGRPVSQGGRDHTSHRLVFLGLSERHAVLTLYGLSLCTGGLSLAVLFVDATLFYALTTFVGIGLGVFGVHVARASMHRTDATQGDGRAASSLDPRRVLHDLFGHRWKAAGGIFVDALLVGAAFVVAHHLRYEGGITALQEARMLEALPLVVGAKVSTFYAMGLYGGIWRHAGTPELVRTGMATIVAAGATFGVYAALHEGATMSVSVLVIDWMTVILAVVAVRFGFRGLRQCFAATRSAGRRVLLYGAGDAGMLTLRELRRNDALDRQPVGFIDDDPLKQDQTIQGVKVRGTGDELVQVCRDHDVDEVIVTTTTMPTDRQRAVSRRCRDANIPCAAFNVTVESLQADREASTDGAEIVVQ
jgi:UDP-GlcNAc:undecaprenyl-phosphate GlcNAc-1-phosphate transferase